MNYANLIKPDCNIVILTGAGISAESGIKTFRAADGLWENQRIEDVATPEAFARNPALVHEFYNMRRATLLQNDIQPNPAHLALAELGRSWNARNGGLVLLVTQNIDDLHERAGFDAQALIHMHGELLKMFYAFCARHTGNEAARKFDIVHDLDTGAACPECNKSGGMRPDIVWFGEMPYQMERIYQALSDCDLFVSIGTSGNVYPAAGFVQQAALSGAVTLEINLEPSVNAHVFDNGLYGAASEKVPEFVKEILRDF